MSIEFPCANCGQLLRTPDESAGKHARCPRCQQVSPVPLGPGGAASSSAVTVNPFADPSPSESKAGNEPFNPYTAPTARVSPAIATATGDLVHRTINIGETLTCSWKILSEEFSQCVLVGLVYFAVQVGLMVVGAIFAVMQQLVASDLVHVVMQLSSSLLNFVVQTWLMLGMARWSLKMVRTRRAEVNDVFSAGPYLLRGLGAGLLLWLLLFGGVAIFVGVPVGVGAWLEQQPVMVIGGIAGAVVLLVVALVVALTVFLYYYFIVDRNLGVVESFRMSSRFMKGNRVSAFAVFLLVGAVGGIGVMCTCYLGLIVYAPYLALVVSMIYLMATGQPYADQIEKSPFKEV